MKRFLLIFIILINIFYANSQVDTNIYEYAKRCYFDKEYFKSIKIFSYYINYETDPIYRSNCYHLIGSSYYSLGDYDKAAYNLDKSLEINKLIGDFKRIAYSYNNLGAIYDVQNKSDYALELYQKSLDIYLNLNDTLSISAALNNISSAKINLGMYESALVDLEKAKTINELLDNKEYSIYTYINIGICFNKLNSYNNAIINHKKALLIANEINNQYLIAKCYLNLGEDYKDIDRKKSIEYLNNSYSISLEINDLLLQEESLFLLSSLYENVDIKKSFTYYKEYVRVKDVLYNLENEKYISYLNIKYKTQEKENKINTLKYKKTIERKEIELLKNKNYLTSFILAILFTSVFIIIILLNKINMMLKENTKNRNDLINKNRNIAYYIKYSKNIERMLNSDNISKNLDKQVLIYHKQKDIVGGDFIWSFDDDINNKTYFTVGDCIGDGISGSMNSLIGYNMLNKLLIENRSIKTSDLMNDLNERIYNMFNGTSIDLSLCVLDKENMILQTCLSKNNIYILRKEDKPSLKGFIYYKYNDCIIYKINSNRKLVGTDLLNSFNINEIQLQKDDMLYIFTDGIVNQFGGYKDKKFKHNNFRNLLSKIHTKSEFNQRQLIDKEFNSWKGDNEQTDDLLILGIRI